MKLSIIETGIPPVSIREAHPRYPAMFESLLAPTSQGLTYETVSLIDGHAALPDPEDLEAILITGSPYGVYDTPDWMRPLKEWIGFAAEARTPMVGVCFGHQVIADALGGAVGKSPKGWGIGRHSYDVESIHTFDTSGTECFSLAVSHQDQVFTPPPTARTVAKSDFCEHAGLVYTHAPILSFQGHPEFSTKFAADLYNARKGNPLAEDHVDTAISSLGEPIHNDLVGTWIADFLRDNLKAK